MIPMAKEGFSPEVTRQLCELVASNVNQPIGIDADGRFINQTLRTARQSKGLDQAGLADAVGITDGFVAHLEGLVSVPSKKTGERIADVVNIEQDIVFPVWLREFTTRSSPRQRVEEILVCDLSENERNEYERKINPPQAVDDAKFAVEDAVTYEQLFPLAKRLSSPLQRETLLERLKGKNNTFIAREQHKSRHAVELVANGAIANIQRLLQIDQQTSKQLAPIHASLNGVVNAVHANDETRARKNFENCKRFCFDLLDEDERNLVEEALKLDWMRYSSIVRIDPINFLLWTHVRERNPNMQPSHIRREVVGSVFRILKIASRTQQSKLAR